MSLLWLQDVCLSLTATPLACFLLLLVALTLWRIKSIPVTPAVIPGPRGIPLLGNLLQLGKKPHVTLTDWRFKYGDVYQITMGSRAAVVLNGVQTIKQALVKQAGDFAGRPDFYSFKFIGNGNSMGFGDYGGRWKMHRKIAQNALATFSNKKSNPIDKTIATEADVLVSIFLRSSGQPVNPHNEIYLSVGSIICDICFGKKYKRDDSDFLTLVKLNDEFMAFAGAGNPVDIMPWTRFFTQRSFNGFLRILQLMDTFCKEKLEQHIATYNQRSIRDVTDCLIRAVHETAAEEKAAVGLTDEHILTTVQELIGAGFDTIASTLQWAVLYMVTHPDIQEMVYQEILQVVGKERQPTLEDLPVLPFTEATILEVMRHSCIFPFALPHSTTRSTTLYGHRIPEKTLVFVNLWSVTRDNFYFQEPEAFNPLRFLDSSGQVDRSMVDNFLPYGAGRRKCPGEFLARMEIFMFFTRLIQTCKMSCAKGDNPIIDSKYGLTLKPLDFNAVFTPR
ncbi:cytochrome P450 1A4-like isoform X2 [Biomphalaria glabrata]|nr:cytochrome P450 1A4-like isoform X2 [Biomphalaria glabrata]XP_055892539.1 cytochrome P450 1A4-like isoform X2 [Biomphalaria glabrata]